MTLQSTMTEDELLEKYVTFRLWGLRTAMPAVIDSYDPLTQTCTAVPAITDTDMETLEPLKLKPVTSCPVVFPIGGGFVFSFPLERGDTGLLLTTDRMMDAWHTHGSKAQPDDPHRAHSLSDCVFLPGVRPLPDVLPGLDGSKVVLGSLNPLGAKVTISKEGQVTIGTPVVDLLGVVDQLATQVAALATACAAITVGGVTTGPGVSAVPVNAAALAAVAAAVSAVQLQLATIKGA